MIYSALTLFLALAARAKRNKCCLNNARNCNENYMGVWPLCDDVIRPRQDIVYSISKSRCKYKYTTIAKFNPDAMINKSSISHLVHAIRVTVHTRQRYSLLIESHIPRNLYEPILKATDYYFIVFNHQYCVYQTINLVTIITL